MGDGKGDSMIEISTQIRDACPICKGSFGLYYLPYGDEAVEKSKEYKVFQIMRSLFYGIRKPRSVKQLNRFFGKCAVIAENNDDPSFNSKEKVAEQIKIALEFTNTSLIIVKPDKSVHIPYRSIAFKNLGHMSACRFFERADDVFDLFCRKLKIDPSVLEREARGRE